MSDFFGGVRWVHVANAVDCKIVDDKDRYYPTRREMFVMAAMGCTDLIGMDPDVAAGKAIAFADAVISRMKGAE